MEKSLIALGTESSYDMSTVNVGALGLAVPLIHPGNYLKLSASPTRAINIRRHLPEGVTLVAQDPLARHGLLARRILTFAPDCLIPALRDKAGVPTSQSDRSILVSGRVYVRVP